MSAAPKSPPKPHGIFIALGSNLGDRSATLDRARIALCSAGDIQEHAISAYYETQPVGGPANQPDFLNAVAEIATELSPETLLGRLQAIEQQFGRTRDVVNGPRTLDLDLLLYHNVAQSDARLSLPHPRMWQRAFVMEPLREICPLPRLAEFAALAGISLDALRT